MNAFHQAVVLKQESVKELFLWPLLALAVLLPLEFLPALGREAPTGFSVAFLALIVVTLGRPVLEKGIRSLIGRRLSNINLLMTIAVIGASALGQYGEASILIVLFAIGERLEDYGSQKSREALHKLMRETPSTAEVKGSSQRRRVEEISAGEIILVRPGEKVPLDGIVTQGHSDITEAVITGEPYPRYKEPGSPVYAGTLNGAGALEVKVTKAASNTTLARIIELTSKLTENKAQFQKFIERFSRYYTPAIIIIAALIAVLPPLLLQQPARPWFIQALSLLIISCPCALVISTPISLFSAVGNAGRHGVIVKGGHALEALTGVRAIALDKTRTLTKGQFKVSDIIPAEGQSESNVLSVAAAVESQSEHPIARAIVDQSKNLNLSDLHQTDNFRAIPGKGGEIRCLSCGGQLHIIGNLQLLLERGWRVPTQLSDAVTHLQDQGKSVVLVAAGAEVIGVIAVIDVPREEAKSFIHELAKLNITPLILTGDSQKAASFAARELGIARAHGDLLPEQKAAAIDKLKNESGPVAMLGDGVNDAPALAAASVSLAMGAMGSDLAIENADIALMNDNLLSIPWLIQLSRRCVKTIRANVFLAIIVKCAVLVLALLGRTNLITAIFADVGVTVIVVLNGLSLFKYGGLEAALNDNEAFLE